MKQLFSKVIVDGKRYALKTTAHSRWIITCALYGILAAIWYTLFIFPPYAAIRKNQTIIEQTVQHNQLQVSFLDQQNQLEQKIAYWKAYKSRFDQDKAEYEEPCATIVKRLNDHSLTLISYTPSQTFPMPTTSYAMTSATIMCQGSYENLKRFITALHTTSSTIRAHISSITVHDNGVVHCVIEIQTVQPSKGTYEKKSHNHYDLSNPLLNDTDQ